MRHFFLGFIIVLSADVWAADRVDFIRDVQPIFKQTCNKCHGFDKQKGKLRFDIRADAMKGGKDGVVIVPGNAAKSELYKRLTSKDKEELMPQKEGGDAEPLPAEKIKMLKDWIDQGAVWPDSASDLSKHWAFQKPVRPTVPKIQKAAARIQNPIDSFILARLGKEGLKPSPEADRTTLIRRVTLDLTGLPPTPEEVDAFLADKSPGAYEKVVDRLLASPHYGERMALPWLDAARYADSNGFQKDGDTYQYLWRDWVVNALNKNMPFDQFTIEQLAGDLLPHSTLEQKIASGFNRCHMLNGEGGAIPEEQRNVIVFDRVDVTATNWLALTIFCCQCHDHKYDPLKQSDYYSFFAFFNNVPETGVPKTVTAQYRVADPTVYVLEDKASAGLELEEEKLKSEKGRLRQIIDNLQEGQAAWEQKIIEGTLKQPVNIVKIVKIHADQRDAVQKKVLSDKYFFTFAPYKTAKKKVDAAQKKLDDAKASTPQVMVMSDAQPRQTHILKRGNYELPMEEVSARTPASLPPMQPAEPGKPQNRLGLARWLVSPENPLTARVQVNRYWQLFFGLGLVKTPENFGTQCEPPLHPELLDWLAVEFRENGWNMKAIHKLIVMSATYRQNSKMTPALHDRDPENQLDARGPRFRLPSFLLRDLALTASGLLNPALGGKPVYPYQPKDIWDGLAITKERDFTYPQSKGADLYRRSLYTFWRRTVAPANMFDASVRQTCKVRPSLTSIPLHALTMLNDITWVEASRVLAERVMKEQAQSTAKDKTAAAISAAYRRICAHPPASADLKILRRGYDRALAAYRADPKAAAQFLQIGDSPRDAALDPIEHAAYANVCLSIFNLDEAVTKE